MISNRKFIVMGVLVSALLAGGASFYANSNPDGLEKVAQDIGFILPKIMQTLIPLWPIMASRELKMSDSQLE